MDENPSVLLQPPVTGVETSLSNSPGAEEAAPGAPPPYTNTEASRLFGQEIGQLPGVLKVERWGEDGRGTPTFHVYVRPDDRDTEYAIYELHGQIYDRYPNAHLEVVVLEAIEAPVGNSAASA